MLYNYTFGEQDFDKAFSEWGANCGPGALAFALQVGIDKVRGMIPDFEEKKFTSPTMMQKALANADQAFELIRENRIFDVPWTESFRDVIALTRIQWNGPWTAPGANPRWAYKYTHWIATWKLSEDADLVGIGELKAGADMVFDVNGGIRTFESWKTDIAPLLAGMYPRADGTFVPTHIYRLKP